MLPNSTYQSYLIRFWRDNAHSPWHAQLQSTADDEQHVFAKTSELFDFLVACLTARSEGGDGVDDSETTSTAPPSR